MSAPVRDPGELGKAPPMRYMSGIAIHLDKYVDIDKVLPAIPSAYAVGTGVTYKIYWNDRWGDCTCAAQGHRQQQQTKKDKHYLEPTDDNIWELFDRTGKEQGLSNNDGRYMEGVLRSLKNTGMKQPDNSYNKILGYAAINPKDHAMMVAAQYLFGGVYIGVALPISAQNQYRTHKMWTYVGDAPGGWGGHAITMTSYSRNYYTVATWASRQTISWAFHDHYVDEAFAVLSNDWLGSDYKSPPGFALSELTRDLQQV